MFRGLIVVGVLLAGVFVVALLVAGGGDMAVASDPPNGQEAVAGPPNKEPQIAPGSPANSLAQLIAGNSQFAFDLYQHLCQNDGNFLYSPYSISQALAMTYAGARNRTEQQMASVLYFTLSQDDLHPAFKALGLELRLRGEGARGQDGKAFRLRIANALWGQKSFDFRSSFLDVVTENYGVGLRLLDFRKDWQDARAIINKWATDQTEGRVKDLFSPETIRKDTRLVLANAIYFNAAWQYPFEEHNTHDDDFHLLNGTKIRVPMMSQTASFGYVESNGIQAVELQYDGGQLSMLVLLPNTGWLKSVKKSLRSLEKSLNAEWVASILANLSYAKVRLAMPKFKYESMFALNGTLATMGMPDAFLDDYADFSGMTGKRNLKIDHVVHKAYVLVDESGTEAAAVTGVGMCLITSMQQEKPPIVVRIDHPFVYLIRDIKTGAIIFVGRVVDPRADF